MNNLFCLLENASSQACNAFHLMGLFLIGSTPFLSFLITLEVFALNLIRRGKHELSVATFAPDLNRRGVL